MPHERLFDFDTVSKAIQEPALDNLFLFTITHVPSVTGEDALRSVLSSIGSGLLVQTHVEQVGIELLNLSPDELRHSVLRSPFIQDVETNQVTLSFVDDPKYTMLRFLNSWNDRIWNGGRGSMRGTVNPPAQYQFDAELSLIDLRSEVGEVQVPLSIGLQKMVPTNVPELQFDYGSGDRLIHNVDFQIEDFKVR